MTAGPGPRHRFAPAIRAAAGAVTVSSVIRVVTGGSE